MTTTPPVGKKPGLGLGFKILTGLFLALFVSLVITWGALGALQSLMQLPGPVPPDQAEQTVVMVDKGMGLNAIAQRLEASGVVANAFLFRLGVYRYHATRALKAGEYAIPARASMFAVMEILREGKALLHRITVPEGLTTAQALRIVANDPVLTGEITVRPGEGRLLPDTYLFTRGETRDALVSRMVDAQAALIDQLWPGRDRKLPYSTREQALTLASIVEKETGLAEERPRVAAVFVNRLRKGMRLQSDPTIIYGLTGGEPLGRGLRVSELQRQTPYNTYLVDGLPPTPIANPGRDAIAAVLNPPASNDLYFVADGSGGHAFSGTLAEHERNVQHWREVERRQKASGG